MSSDIRRLYFFHFFLSVSLTAVGSFLFIDRLFLHMGLSMSQFGLIKGVAYLIPVTVNLALAPYLARLGRDREIASVSYLIRILLPYLFLLVPWFSFSKPQMALVCSAIFAVTMICPFIAFTSLSALCRYHIPKGKLGHHMGNILSLTTVPSVALAIPATWYVDLNSSAGDERFYGAYLRVFLLTTIFILPAVMFLQRLSRRRPSVPRPDRASLREIITPFRNRPFRVYLHASFMLSLVGSMILSFINPYLLGPRGLSMFQVSLITVAVAGLGVGMRLMWGNVCDQYGGKNVLRISVVGVAVALFFLSGQGLIPILIFAVLAWNTSEGLFGAGIVTAQQYLSLALSDEQKVNVYVATTSFVNGVGMFIGAILGGFLLDWLSEQMRPDRGDAHYIVYFTYCALAYLIVGHFITALRDGRRRVRSGELLLRIYRAFRSRMRH